MIVPALILNGRVISQPGRLELSLSSFFSRYYSETSPSNAEGEIASFSSPIIVASADLVEEAECFMVENSISASRLIIEPLSRNLPILLSILALLAGQDNDIVLIPSDCQVTLSDNVVQSLLRARAVVAPSQVAVFSIPRGHFENQGFRNEGSDNDGDDSKPNAQATIVTAEDGEFDPTGIMLFNSTAYLNSLLRFDASLVAAGEMAIAGPGLSRKRLAIDKRLYAEDSYPHIEKFMTWLSQCMSIVSLHS